ncbi:hypothetical protein Tco_1126061, partial [Tanacetum coccineum]
EALKLQTEFDEEDRLAREKAQQVEEANIAWDDIQAKIDADYQLAKRLQAQEQQELTIEKKSTLFQQLLEKRRKFFAVKRAEEKRNRPPTRAQQRSIMCTYLKNMAGWKPKDLKNKSFTNIQKLFNKAMKRVNTFVDMDTKLVEGSEVRAEGSETRKESSSKRAGDELEQEKAKKQNVDEDKETAELQSLMKIVPDAEEVAIDVIPLATKPPSKSPGRFQEWMCVVHALECLSGPLSTYTSLKTSVLVLFFELTTPFRLLKKRIRKLPK